MFYIVNQRQEPLSAYYRNATYQLRFGRKDCITFSNESEAGQFLQHIRETTKHKKKAANLQVSAYAKW